MISPLDDDDLMGRVRQAAPPAVPDPARLDALARRIAASAAPTLTARARRGDGLVAVASRWSRVAIPIAMAAGVGAIMVLMQAGSSVGVTVAAAPATDTVTARLVGSLAGGEGLDGGAALAAASGLALEATR